MKEVHKIKKLMMDALEQPDEKGVLLGDYVCHEDIPEEVPYMDAHFTVCGEEGKPVYVVLIQKVNP